ncbi:50S ribosomal protein L29 [Candidatus Wolfebacteria bacterium]|nr:50S ribosomal protein L29 [Candidatus Wolfebacteria bacterium]
MKKQDFQQLKNKATAELQKDLKTYQEKLRDLKFDLAAGKIKNIGEIKNVKKAIAKILTIINSNKD